MIDQFKETFEMYGQDHYSRVDEQVEEDLTNTRTKQNILGFNGAGIKSRLMLMSTII